ncbi:MAG: PRC-barrel domain-containing protein [Anaerolineae bacterium]|jgi:sporulation protein YlmC with PRC-barrel domain
MDEKIGDASDMYRNVTKGTLIFCADGPIGEVHDMLIDPETGRPTHIILREGILVIKEVNIPVHYVQKVEGDRVLLKVDRGEIERLPRFWW